MQPFMLPLDQIRIDPTTRVRDQIYPEKVAWLAEQIAEQAASDPSNQGLLEPIIVTRDHELVIGEHRYLAHKLLGLTAIYSIYTDQTDPKRLQAMKIAENLYRIGPENWQEEARWIGAYRGLTGKSLKEIGELNQGK